MHKASGWDSENNLNIFARLSNTIHSTCVRTVDNLRANIGKDLVVINTVLMTANLAVHKSIKNTLTFTQVHLLLCTAFQHILDTFSSVNSVVVHIFHIAYKENRNLKKGF